MFLKKDLKRHWIYSNFKPLIRIKMSEISPKIAET